MVQTVLHQQVPRVVRIAKMLSRSRMKDKTYNLLDISVQAIIVGALFIWNVIEGAIFENEYPVALVKLYKYPIWRAALLLLIIFSADWSPFIALMLAFTLFFYIMDIEVTRERWLPKELKRKA